MKKSKFTPILILALCLLLTSLTACQGAGQTETDKLWSAARKADSLEEYIKEQKDAIDTEALRREAESSESTLSQRFKAAALLCALEYSRQRPDDSFTWKNQMLYLDYPETAVYADGFLAEVNTAGEDFWKAMEDAFYPYDCFLPILAASEQLDGPTLVKLMEEVPEDSKFADKWEETLEQWIRANPGRLAELGGALAERGYFDSWGLTDWREVCMYDYTHPYLIRMDTIDGGLGYLAYVRDEVLAGQEAVFGADYFKEESALLGELCYATKMTVTVKEELPLYEWKDAGASEFIETEGKKVVAFYRNLQSGQFEDSPPALRILGDFMLQLPAQECPASLAEADYYLVLTPSYEYGEFYQMTGGGDTRIREVYSSTSVDLFDAASGSLIRHLGNIMEEAPDTVVANYGTERLQYPEQMKGDILVYLYRHINEPEACRALFDMTSENPELAAGETAVMGSWEITYQSSEFLSGFEGRLRSYEPEAGCQFVSSLLTIRNIGFEEETFLSLSSSYSMHYSTDEVYVQLVDLKNEEAYAPLTMMMEHDCLNDSYLSPEESKEGVLIFEIPQEASERPGDFYLAIYLGNQTAYYPLFES